MGRGARNSRCVAMPGSHPSALWKGSTKDFDQVHYGARLGFWVSGMAFGEESERKKWHVEGIRHHTCPGREDV